LICIPSKIYSGLKDTIGKLLLKFKDAPPLIQLNKEISLPLESSPSIIGIILLSRNSIKESINSLFPVKFPINSSDTFSPGKNFKIPGIRLSSSLGRNQYPLNSFCVFMDYYSYWILLLQ